MLVKPAVALVLCAVQASFSANRAAAGSSELKRLFEEERWQEIASANSGCGSADACFYLGSALAHLGRSDDARKAFHAGRRIRPKDPRFPTELAGVAFKEKNYPEAKAWLRRAVRLEPGDAYINDFLGTVFFLEGNRDAAIKYWNRLGKPYIESIFFEPAPKTRPALLDRAFAFSRADMLRLRDLQSSEARLEQLNVFHSLDFKLQARDEGNFNLAIDDLERNGCGHGKWECLLRTFGQAPAQTLAFDYFNIGRRAINFQSLVRWDGEKRRLRAQIETPLEHRPGWHLLVRSDLRNENWAIRSSFSGLAPLDAALNLKREAVAAEFTRVVTANWQWSAQSEFSRRDYHDVAAGKLPRELFASGSELKQGFTSDWVLLRLVERRLTLEAEAKADAARLWSEPVRHFATLSGDLRLDWLPQHTGDRYQLDQRAQWGTVLGHPAFDELFMTGVLGDAGLLMRAHIATRDGKKGSAPIGTRYFISNWDLKRRISSLAPVGMRLGPFVDTGTISGPAPSLGSRNWLCDTGIEARLEVFGFAVDFSYGRDLRSGKNALLARLP
jgi:tetratricopeptide (TPR) repeat protein